MRSMRSLGWRNLEQSACPNGLKERIEKAIQPTGDVHAAATLERSQAFRDDGAQFF